MPNKKIGLVLKDDYNGWHVRVIKDSGKVMCKRITSTHYLTNPPPYFPVEVENRWYACMRDKKNDLILIAADKHMEFKYEDRVYRIMQVHGSSMLTLVVRNATPVASVRLDTTGAWLVFTGGETPPKQIQNYPENPTTFFALCIENEVYAFFAKDTGHVVIEVPSTPMTFDYGGSSYVVTCDGSTPYLCRTT